MTAPFDLQALLRSARAQSTIKTTKQAFKARIEQRELAERRTNEHVQSLAKRQSLAKALSSEGIDAMRFRFLGEHSQHIARLAGLSLDEMRREIDLMISREAIRALSEMRREQGT